MEQNKNRMKAMTVHPTEAIRQAAVEARSLFDKYSDPTALAQKQESGVLYNLPQDLKAIDNSKQTLLTLTPWIMAKETFLAAVSQRTEEDSARQTGIVKERRIATDNAYRSLVEIVNALAVENGEEPYATFINQENVIISRQKTIMRTRSTKAENNKEKTIV